MNDLPLVSEKECHLAGRFCMHVSKWDGIISLTCENKAQLTLFS